jgi:ACR3 family arsenite transporter
MSSFERYLTLWVALAIGAGIALGHTLPALFQAIGAMAIAKVNLPVAVLIWAMIVPMLMKIDFAAMMRVGEHWRGIGVTLFTNWAVKPFTMALLGWLFIGWLFRPLLPADQIDSYIAGLILLAAAPCTAMVFVWSYLSGGDPNYTLVQVSVNDLILLVLFIPIVQLLLGITGIVIPWGVLITSVLVFVLIPLVAGYLTHRWLMRTKGEQWFKTRFLPTLKPLSITALLATLVLLFAFQGQRILNKPLDILLIAIPLTIQTYFIFFLTWKSGRWLGLNYRTCAPASMVGASNFFELAVAVAIALFGLNSGAALVTVVGVLIEVPIMLHLVKIAKRWRYA